MRKDKPCTCCPPEVGHGERRAIYQRLCEETDLSRDNVAAIMRAICDMRYYCTEEMRKEKSYVQRWFEENKVVNLDKVIKPAITSLLVSIMGTLLILNHFGVINV